MDLNANKQVHYLTLIMILDKPSPPQELKVTGYSKDSISVSWSAPESDGGSPLTAYIVERRDAKRNTWMTAGTLKPDETELTVTKLIEGNEYLIRVFAENSVGASEPAETEPVTAKIPFGELCFPFPSNFPYTELQQKSFLPDNSCSQLISDNHSVRGHH